MEIKKRLKSGLTYILLVVVVPFSFALVPLSIAVLVSKCAGEHKQKSVQVYDETFDLRTYDDGYEEGNDDGYKEGYEEGYSDGFADAEE